MCIHCRQVDKAEIPSTTLMLLILRMHSSLVFLGLYAISPGVNVPCLFYVDFEDQVFCYYDVRVSPGPVTGFIDMINDDVKEALERISSIDGEIRVLAGPDSNGEYLDSDTEEVMDLGDGWRGIADGGQDTTDANGLGAQPTGIYYIHA